MASRTGEHEPVSRRVQREADLICDRGTTGRSIGSELRLVQLDEVLGLPARAIEGGVNPFRRAVFDVGDDETGVEPERSGFDAGDGASLAAPGFGLVARFRRQPRTTGLFDKARSVRTASAASSIFFASGFEPGSPKT